MVIADIIPGHTGKGADFRLAERAVDDYPGLFHMVALAPPDWYILPAIPAGVALLKTVKQSEIALSGS